jgi:hypothetical protein
MAFPKICLRWNIFSSCSSSTNVVQPLTTIDGDPIRDEIAGKVENLIANGGTCLGAGLKRGLDVSICKCISWQNNKVINA